MRTCLRSTSKLIPIAAAALALAMLGSSPLAHATPPSDWEGAEKLQIGLSSSAASAFAQRSAIRKGTYGAIVSFTMPGPATGNAPAVIRFRALDAHVSCLACAQSPTPTNSTQLSSDIVLSLSLAHFQSGSAVHVPIDFQITGPHGGSIELEMTLPLPKLSAQSPSLVSVARTQLIVAADDHGVLSLAPSYSGLFDSQFATLPAGKHVIRTQVVAPAPGTATPTQMDSTPLSFKPGARGGQ